MNTVNWGEFIENAEVIEDFQPIPTGLYELEIEKAEATRTKTDKDMFKLTYVVAEGEYKNRKIFGNQVISPESPKAMGFLFKFFSALGFTREYLGENKPELSQLADMMVGRRITAQVGVKSYQGNESNEVKWTKEPKTPNPVPGKLSSASADPF